MTESEGFFTVLSEKIMTYDWMELAYFTGFTSNQYPMLFNYQKLFMKHIMIKQLHILYYSRHHEVAQDISYRLATMVSRCTNHTDYLDVNLPQWLEDGMFSNQNVFVMAKINPYK